MHYEGDISNFPENNESHESLMEKARTLHWYHTLDLGGCKTKGYFDLDHYRQYCLLPKKMTGMRCLDVGTSNGYWCFEMEQRGAAGVTAIDIDAETYSELNFVDEHRAPATTADATEKEQDIGSTFRVAAVLKKSQSVYRVCDVLKLNPGLYGTFDVVFCGSMLMHVHSPLIALRNMLNTAEKALIINTQTLLEHTTKSIAEYYGHIYPYVFFTFSPTCLKNMLKACGASVVIQGPTYNMEYCDPARYAEPVTHTSFIALKNIDVADLFVPVSTDGASDFRVSWSMDQIPPDMRANQEQALTLRATNSGNNDWWAGLNETFRLEVLARRKLGPIAGAWHSLKTSCSLPDYLPAGVDTLIPVQFNAPNKPGKYEFRVELLKKDHAFENTGNTRTVRVL